MKTRITSSLVLALSLAAVLITLPPAAQAQQRKQRFIYETGVFLLGPNQKLRLSVVETQFGFTARFGKAVLAPDGCNNEHVCKYSIASQSLSDPVTLNLGEAATFDISGSGSPVRGAVISDRRDMRVNVAIVDVDTGEITAFFINIEALPVTEPVYGPGSGVD